MERPKKRPRVQARQAEADKQVQFEAPPTPPLGAPPKRSGLRCPYEDCDQPDGPFEEEDGKIVCTSCGTVVEERNIVNEVTFGETSAGAAVVQGSFLGEGQTHTNQTGYHGGGSDSREQSENRGRYMINRLGNAVEPPLSETTRNQAFTIYKLLLNSDFIRGRQIKHVASACLYLTCRRNKDNQVLLMDFAEILTVSVYKLGQIFAAIRKELCLSHQDNRGVDIINPEAVIYKFARKMEFGQKLMRVCEDAAKIMRRMQRDWMVTGRSPAGLCGACIILAAHMNNFRRTVREVVYTVRVSDMTVAKRLQEFKLTKASELSVEDFRSKGHLLRANADPPSYYLARQKEEKALLQASVRHDSEGFAIPPLPSDRSRSRSTSQQPNEEEQRPQDPEEAAAEDFANDEPGLPTPGPSQDEGSRADSPSTSTTSKRGRKKREKSASPRVKKPALPPKAPYQLTDNDLLSEENLENEINTLLQDKNLEKLASEAAQESALETARAIAEEERAKLVRRSSNGYTGSHASSTNGANGTNGADGQLPTPESTQQHSTSFQADASHPSPPLSQTPLTLAALIKADKAQRDTSADWLDRISIHSDEFAADPEVANCVLREAEARVKERIWVTHNEDWLRLQQAKLLKKDLEEAEGALGVGKPRSRAGRRKKTPQEVPEDDDAGGAVGSMLRKKGANKKFSRHIDYERLNELYGLGRGEGSVTTATTSREPSEVPGSEAAASEAGDPEEDQRQSTAGAKEKMKKLDQKAKAGDKTAKQLTHALKEYGARQAAAGSGQAGEDENEEGLDIDEDLDAEENVDAALTQMGLEDDVREGLVGEEDIEDDQEDIESVEDYDEW